MNRSSDAQPSQKQKTSQNNDNISLEAFENDYEDIFKKHTSLCLNVFASTDYFKEYPYFSSAKISGLTEIEISYTTKDKAISLSETFNRKTGKFSSIHIFYTNYNNENVDKLIKRLSTSLVFSSDNSNTIDIAISEGIYNGLSNYSDEYIPVYNEYGDFVYSVYKSAFTTEAGEKKIGLSIISNN